MRQMQRYAQISSAQSYLCKQKLFDVQEELMDRNQSVRVVHIEDHALVTPHNNGFWLVLEALKYRVMEPWEGGALEVFRKSGKNSTSPLRSFMRKSNGSRTSRSSRCNILSVYRCS